MNSTEAQNYVPPGQGEAGEFLGIAASVAEFHAAFGLPASELPTSDIDPRLASLRIALLEEEAGEFVIAAEKGDLVGIADALADVVYVAYGTALTYGIDLDAMLREVHRSNMSKLGADGQPVVRDDGKVMKSDRYFPPAIGALLDAQGRLQYGQAQSAPVSG